MIADDEQDSARSDGFDPRYDPAFQRGYHPQPGERSRTRVRAVAAAPVRERPRTEVDVDDAFPAAAASSWEAADVVESAPLDLPGASFPVSSSLPETAAAPVVVTAGLLAGAELSPRRNPLMLALWIVGAGLVVLGVVIYAVAVNASYTTSYTGTGGDIGMQVLTQIGWVLAGPMITIGIATMVALLFLTAIVGRRRAPAATGADPDPDDEL